MTRTLDRLIEEFLRGLIIAEVDDHIHVVTSLMGEGEAYALLPRVVIECQSQETPEFQEVGVHRIVTQISSIAEATSPVSSDDMEEMNAAVDRVIVFADNLPTYLSSQDVITHGVVYGGEAQQIEENKLIRVRSAEIWSRLLNAAPLQSQIPVISPNSEGDAVVTITPPPNLAAGYLSLLNYNLGTSSDPSIAVCSVEWITNATSVNFQFRTKGPGGVLIFTTESSNDGFIIAENTVIILLQAVGYVLTSQGLSLIDDATPVEQHATLQLLAGANIAAAATTDLGLATGRVISITGSGGPITALGTTSAGAVRKCRFTGTPTLTHNATSLILPGNTNIVVAIGDCAEFISLGSGNWYCSNYQRQATAP